MLRIGHLTAGVVAWSVVTNLEPAAVGKNRAASYLASMNAWCARKARGHPLSRYGRLRLFGAAGKIVRSEYATIIQHPDGRETFIAGRNSRINDSTCDSDLFDKEKAANNFLYWSTDTLKTSSGSPVSSDQCYIVAQHRTSQAREQKWQ